MMVIKLQCGEKITASKATLNHISLILDAAATTYDADGHHRLAEIARADSHNIYDALDAAGYYNKYR